MAAWRQAADSLEGRVMIAQGMIVTRSGTDRLRVISSTPDLIEVVCIKEPVIEYCDGTRGEPWIKVGERTSFVADRCKPVKESA
jgi:hypothetical protein